MKKALILFLILIFYLRGFSANKYFSASGSDANTGTIISPYKTLAKLSSIFSSLQPGDSVLLKRGDSFFGSITVSKSGTVSLPIVIGAYGVGNRPIITGLTDVINFTNSGNIWTSAANSLLGSNVKIVLSGSTLQTIGRYPNANAPNSGYLTFESSTISSLTDNQLLNTPNYTGWDVCARRQPYLTSVEHVVNHSGTLITTTSFGSTPSPVAGYFFLNNIAALDQQGEYFYNPTTKKISIYSATIPTNVKASAIRVLIRSISFNYITFTDLNLTGANDSAFAIGPDHGTGGVGVVIKNCTIQNTGDVAIIANNSNNIFIYNDTIINSLSNGIRVNNCTDAIFRKNYVNRTYQYAGMGGSGLSGIGIYLVFGTNNIIDSNVIKNSGWCGIYADGNNLLIKNNYIDTACNVKDDGGLIYLVPQPGTVRTGARVINNILLHAIGAPNGSKYTPDALGNGIYLDNNQSKTFVQGNTVAYCNNSGIFLHNGHENTLTNNTVYACTKTQGYIVSDIRDTQLIRSINIKNNIFFSSISTQRTLNATTKNADIAQWGQFDSNYYARPILDNLTINNISSTISLAMWKTAYPGYDVHSNKSPIPTTNVNQTIFVCNPSFVNKDTTLTGNWVDVRNTHYSGTITLTPFTSLVLISSGGLITPTITWPNPSAITYTTALSSTQLNASALVAGTFSYNYPIGTILNAGTYTLTVTFTPTDQTSYTTATASVPLTVNKANATMTYSNLTQVYTGLPLAPTITTNPSRLQTITTLYNNVGATPINAGTYNTISALNNTNYTAASITGTFTITKATAALSVSNISQIYNGSQKSVTVATSPVGLSGVNILYNGSPTLPTNAGSYTVDVSLSNQNYTASPVSTTLVISKATPTVSWSAPSSITYGTALSGTQLNASASVAGTFTYTPASGTILNAGTQTLSVDFTPSDATNYNSINNTTVDIIVNKATASISLGNLIQTYDGNPKTITVTTSPANLQTISVTYNGSSIPPSAVGSYPIIATLTNANYTATPTTGNLIISTSAANIYITNLAQVYTGSPLPVTVTTNPTGLSHTTTYNGSGTVPTNTGTYTVIATINDGGMHTGADTQTLVISKATPVINWNNPSDISFGTALSGTQLNASANVSGTFSYSPASGTILNVGSNQNLSVTFTPASTSNYNTVSKTVTINVTGANATLSLSGLTQVYDGTPKPVIATSSPSGLSGITVTYNASATVPINAGNYNVSASLVNDNYTAPSVSGVLSIAKKSPILTWGTLEPIKSGTALTSIQLSPTSNIAGTFSFNYGTGSVLPTGTIRLVATFTPNDTVNYNSVTISNIISVFGNPNLQFFIRNGSATYFEIP